ncbi:MAG: xanthine dehydrogenase small subunit [Gammaproteobacteria bacterium]|nr:xanthine dehydrogenase small subunit [Gammaproteobacteria bacterium]
MNADTIRFVLDGELVEIRNPDPTRTVLQYLREDLRKIGTKEGCAEGDCGACTVAIAEVDRSGKRLQVRAINSCIQFLPTLDGKELITVESLRRSDGSLHPVQQAMVDYHGSQCGFCTPGFIMSLFALYKNNAEPSRREIDDTLAGNLCRCTGYRPIIEAAEKMYGYRTVKDTWLEEPYAAKCGTQEKKKIALIKTVARRAMLAIDNGGRRFFSPRNVKELASLFESHPGAVILAGGTDVGLWVTKQHQELSTVIYTGEVEELSDLSETKTHIDIGAAVSLSDAMLPIIEHYPEFEELFLRFASPPIRNAGTLGGNIANGSPIGDSMPALMVVDTMLVLRRGVQTRELSLSDFYLDYQKTALEPGEFLERILVPLRRDDTHVQSYKVSKRFDQDISAICGAYSLRCNGAGVEEIRIAYGGVAVVPKRAVKCEAQLKGRQWNEDAVQSGIKALGEEFTPITDMRSTADYRRRVCGNLLKRFYLDSSGNAQPRVYDYGR